MAKTSGSATWQLAALLLASCATLTFATFTTKPQGACDGVGEVRAFTCSPDSGKCYWGGACEAPIPCPVQNSALISISTGTDDVEQRWDDVLHPENLANSNRRLLQTPSNGDVQTGVGIPQYTRFDDDDDDGVDVSRSSSDLEFPGDDEEIGLIGLRFRDVPIPPGANLTEAFIIFTSEENKGEVPDGPGQDIGNTGQVYLRIWGDAADDAISFDDDDEPSLRTPTSKSVFWIPRIEDGWAKRYDKPTTPSLIPIVEEIINRAGWRSKNDMAFIIGDAGSVSNPATKMLHERAAYSFNGDQDLAPKLSIKWECPSY